MLAATSLRPLDDVVIRVADTDLQVRTDASGRFTITALVGPQVTLVIRRVGYRPLRTTVAVGEQSVRVVLAETALDLDAIVVTGTPGRAEARTVGNAVGRIDARDVVATAAITDMQQLLNARVPGVVVIPMQGNVGTGSVTRIRGLGSLLLPNDPLLYVDGVRVDNNNRAGPEIRNGRQMSRINDLNPEDIEGVEIIKGPAAATLYGTEASRGVIQILTRQGHEGPPRVGVVVKQGGNWFMNPAGRLPWVYDTSTAGVLDSLHLYRQEEAAGRHMFQTGDVRSYSINVGGGAHDVRYYLSTTMDRDEGVVSYNWRRRLSARANVTLLPSDHIRVRTSFAYMRSDVRLGQSATLWDLMTQIVWGSPSQPLRGFFRATPEDVATIVSRSDVDRVIGSVQLEHQPRPWLGQHLTLGMDVGDEESSRLFPRHPLGDAGPFEGRSLGEKTVDRRRVRYSTLDYRLSATANLSAALQSVTSVGAQYHGKYVSATQIVGTGFPTPDVTEVLGAGLITGSEQSIANKTVGMFGEQRLAWKGRRFVTAALRADDNSAFGATFNPVTYPKLQASWVVNEEPFWKFTPWLTALRLRAAWGRAGQQPDVFAALRSYQPTPGPDGQAAITPWNVGNPGLKPERGQELELGLDVGLLHDRVGVELTYYDQRTSNAIVPSVLPPSGGFPGTRLVNIGEVMNRGFELAFRAYVIEARTFAWDINFNLSANNNRIASLGGAAPVNLTAVFGGVGVFQQWHQQGFPVGSFFLPKIVTAEFDAAGNLINVMCAGGTNLGAPDGSLVACTNTTPNLYAGRPTPRWEGSIGTSITLFGDVQVNGLVDFRGGHALRNVDFGFAHATVGNTRAQLTRADPFLIAYTTLATTQPGRPWVGRTGLIKAGFAKLREVSMTYTLPAPWVRHLGAAQASVTVAGRNLAILWLEQRELFGLKVVDPETRYPDDLSGGVQNVLPQFAQLVTTVRFTF